MKSEVLGKTGLSKVQTQIRLLLLEQCDQGLHCLPFHLHHLVALLHCKIKLLHFFGTISVIILSVQILKFLEYLYILTLLHSEQPKPPGVLAALSAIGLKTSH